jgi:hypothetical protein
MGNILGESRPAFRIRRPLITSNGFGTDPHPTITAQLAEINELLGKRAFTTGKRDIRGDALEAEAAADESERKADDAERAADDARKRAKDDDGVKAAVKAEEASAKAARKVAEDEARAARELRKAAQAYMHAGDLLDIDALLRVPLTPKRAVDDDPQWADDSAARLLKDAPDYDGAMTLSEIIDSDPELSELSAEFDAALRHDLFTLSDEKRTILGGGYPSIRDYLVLYGVGVLGIDDADGLKNFVVNMSRGAARFADYATVGAAREIVKRRNLDVDDYNEDDGLFAKQVRLARLSFSGTSFEKGVLKVAGSQATDVKEVEYRRLLEEEATLAVPEKYKARVVKAMVTWPVKATEDNVDYVVSSILAQIAEEPAAEALAPSTPEESDKDFDVDFFEDDGEQIQVSRSSVKCASQLFYAMVVGDELDVFGVVNYFTHRYLLRGGIEIVDRTLRDDLQNYVFSNRFVDLRTGQLVDRTRPAERQMFSRQVFNTGDAQVTEDVIVNDEFPRLWKTLMLESAQYLERAQQSPNPDSYVSRQNVMQAVEDLQYNLSTHCTGMATVITPLIYQELNFVIRRILMHEEVRRQIVPTGGTWWRVVERLCMEYRHAKPNATVLYNKARLGHDIIASIAAYEPAAFENEDTFSAFISTVDAFITTQSILQDALTDDLKRDQVELTSPTRHDGQPAPMAGAHAAEGGGSAVAAGVSAGSNGKAPTDEWDF